MSDSKIVDLVPALAEAADAVLQEVQEYRRTTPEADWEHSGGYCDEIAAAMGTVLDTAGIDYHTQYSDSDFHTSVIADVDGRAVLVDVPYQVYEVARGPYTFDLKPGARISASDVVVAPLDVEYEVTVGGGVGQSGIDPELWILVHGGLASLDDWPLPAWWAVFRAALRLYEWTRKEPPVPEGFVPWGGDFDEWDRVTDAALDVYLGSDEPVAFRRGQRVLTPPSVFPLGSMGNTTPSPVPREQVEVEGTLDWMCSAWDRWVNGATSPLPGPVEIREAMKHWTSMMGQGWWKSLAEEDWRRFLHEEIGRIVLGGSDA